jgi:hypothetical protein
MKKYRVVSFENSLLKTARIKAIIAIKSHFGCNANEARIIGEDICHFREFECIDTDIKFWVDIIGLVIDNTIFPETLFTENDIYVDYDGKLLGYSEEEYRDVVIKANEWYNEQPKEIRKMIAILRNENPKYIAPSGAC